MRSSLIRFAFAGLASLALVTSANAATILQFSQASSSDVITDTVTGGVSTLVTGTGPAATPIAVSLGNLGGVTGPFPAIETFTLTNTGPGTTFSGTITFNQGTPAAPGALLLSDTVTGAVLTITGNGATLSTGTSVFNYPVPGAINAQIGPPPASGASSLSFSNVSFTGTTGGTAQNSGTFSTAVPEPASLVSGGLALLIGLGYFGVRRFKAPQA